MKDPLETMVLVVDTNRYCTIQWGVFEALVGLGFGQGFVGPAVRLGLIQYSQCFGQWETSVSTRGFTKHIPTIGPYHPWSPCHWFHHVSPDFCTARLCWWPNLMRSLPTIRMRGTCQRCPWTVRSCCWSSSSPISWQGHPDLTWPSHLVYQSPDMNKMTIQTLRWTMLDVTPFL